ncbi:hypothetical protein CERZMDRAFT_116541 [Cercospora zeae-maydis SCOH1-5]|uniref:Thiolase N-terminal domain-containing protein n=1 Tax=Cercospora zeae-maydis SCOH1-5 TaxID=717836 RepID=A0A6A6FRF0_9PEZI|nr:hypothetical protein CERZMDRAFT_116541 [Cercospora zeae-maydis SCOH1-5]
MSVSKVHIAGVAVAGGEDGNLREAAIAAGTRAMLDAGVTYTDVDQSIVAFEDELRIPRRTLDTFGMEGAPVCEINNGSALFTAAQSVRSGQSNCTLVLGLDTDTSKGASSSQRLVVGMVLVSELFLTSHAYLKDSSVRICGSALASPIHLRSLGGSDASRTARTAINSALRQARLKPTDIQLLHLPHDLRERNPRALSGFDATTSELSRSLKSCSSSSTGLAALVTLVWQFRGWTGDLPVDAHNCLLYTAGREDVTSVVIISRSDGRAAVKWEEVEHVRDGRERVGYNAATTTRKICVEDVEAVRARVEFVPEAQQRLQLPVKGGDRAALARL